MVDSQVTDVTSAPTEPAAPLIDDTSVIATLAIGDRTLIGSRLVAIAFWLTLAVPGFLAVAGFRPPALENRNVAYMPELRLDRIGDGALYAAIDAAINDAFPVKAFAVEAHAALDFGLLGGSTNPDVVVAQDGWLFPAEEALPTCVFTADETLGQVDRAAAATEAAGMDFRYLIAPDKHAIYPERLPDTIDPLDMCTDQRRQAIRDGFAARPGTTVDGWAALDAERQRIPDEPLFFTSDSHWTPEGARPAVRALIESLQPGLWFDSEVAAEPVEAKTTDLSRQLGLPRTEDSADLVARPNVELERTTIESGVDLRNAAAIPWFKTPPGPEVIPGRTLILYDSFFYSFFGGHIPLIAPWFEESVWVHADDFRRFPEIAASLPSFDRLIVQRAERSAYNLDTSELVRPLLER